MDQAFAAGGGAGPRGFAGALAEAALELLWPTRCAGCDQPGELLCEECRASLPWVDQRFACPVCGAPFGWLTCTECDGAWESRATVCALDFAGAGGVARLVACALTDAHELRLAPVMAAAMATSLDEAAALLAPDGAPRADLAATDAICFVPATAKAFARRGFDHMELVSRELSRLTGVPLADVLVRAAAGDQRALGREQRAENLAGSVGCVADVSGLALLLADDVVTTGASMRECARALLARGARSVTCCAFARVW